MREASHCAHVTRVFCDNNVACNDCTSTAPYVLLLASCAQLRPRIRTVDVAVRRSIAPLVNTMVSRSRRRQSLLDINNGITFRFLPGVVFGFLLHRLLNGLRTDSAPLDKSDSQVSTGSVRVYCLVYLMHLSL